MWDVYLINGTSFSYYSLIPEMRTRKITPDMGELAWHSQLGLVVLLGA
jgi:hypothetical protein